jgi:hypothetical protein
MARKSKKLKELVDIFSENKIDYTKDIDVVVLKELKIVVSDVRNLI